MRRGDDTGALRAAGLVPLATESECVVRLPGDVDEILRARIGAGQLHDLRRHHHAVSCDVTWERIPLTELDGGAWAKDAFVELHRRRTELYNADALDALAHGALADRTEMLVRRSEKTVVQAGLITTSHNGRGLYYLTQAIAHDDPAARHNLHLATLYELYRHARRSGLEWVHLGRGDAHHMRPLGADLFVPLDHWLRAPGLVAPAAEGAEQAVSEFAAPPVTGVPVPGPGPSETNFLFIRLHKHERVMERLRDAGIVVADTGRAIPDTCRITIGDRRANTAVLTGPTACERYPEVVQRMPMDGDPLPG